MTSERSYRRKVRDKYEAIHSIWEDNDPWHSHVHLEIVRAVRRLNELYPVEHGVVIDVGAGGNPQPIQHKLYVQSDIAFERIRGAAWSVCADAQSLPFATRVADCVVCVGPTVNYCSLIDVIAEIARIAKGGAPVLLHVELSNSLEFAFTGIFGARATFAKTFYKGEEFLWVYSHRNVAEALESAGLRVIERRYFHVISALLYRLTRDAALAANFARFDRWLTWIPGIGSISDSAIFICEKVAS